MPFYEGLVKQPGVLHQPVVVRGARWDVDVPASRREPEPFSYDLCAKNRYAIRSSCVCFGDVLQFQYLSRKKDVQLELLGAQRQTGDS
jgi:hypothetical protein